MFCAFFKTIKLHIWGGFFVNNFRYIYFLWIFLLLGLVAGCGKRKPQVLTIPQKLVSQSNVSVGARTCNRSDYQIFLGASRGSFPFDSKLVQIYIKNDTQNRYKLSGKNIQRMSPEIFQTNNGVLLKMYCPLSFKIAGALFLNIPVSVVLGAATTVGFGVWGSLMYMKAKACIEAFVFFTAVGAHIILPTVIIISYLGLSAYAIYKISSKFKKQKIEMADKIKKNLLASNFSFDLESQSETNKVFFVSNKDFKVLQKDGILLSLIDQQTKEKLVFSVPLS